MFFTVPYDSAHRNLRMGNWPSRDPDGKIAAIAAIGARIVRSVVGTIPS